MNGRLVARDPYESRRRRAGVTGALVGGAPTCRSRRAVAGHVRVFFGADLIESITLTETAP